MTEPILVADFGTCFSSAAVLAGTEVQLVREPTTGSFSWPSAVYADEERLLVGTPAASRRNRDPARYRSELKRYLGQEGDIRLGPAAYPAQALVTAVLAALKAEAERVAGTVISRGVLTVPASYGRADQRRALMIAAAEATGLRTVELLAEPVAAVFAPTIGPRPAAEELVLIYDFGGGTFDAALVRVTAVGHEVLGSSALDDCGGLDVDAVLVSRLTADARGWLPGAASGVDGAGSTSLRLKVTFGDVARNLKHQLSDVMAAEDFILPDAPATRLTRAELTQLASPFLDRTLQCCRELLNRLSVTVPEVSAILAVGGSTRMPAVTDALRRAFDRPLRRTEDPDLAVVRGAALWASSYAVRSILALPREPGLVLLRWMIPPASLLRWLVPVGTVYQEGAPLARVRFHDGTVWDLCARRAGRIEQVFVGAGYEVRQELWLASAREL
jgi:molecular chaperone DnaK (HSP70)